MPYKSKYAPEIRESAIQYVKESDGKNGRQKCMDAKFRLKSDDGIDVPLSTIYYWKRKFIDSKNHKPKKRRSSLM